MPYNQLTPEQKQVIEDKKTETPFNNEYDDFFLPGTFICRRCNSPLFSSKAKFDAHCGWPSFDESFPGALKRVSSKNIFDNRTEVVCAHCGAHLGHEFIGEGFTKTNTRECVNSASIKFIEEGKTLPPVLDEK